MAVLKGPLFSLQAKGQFAKTIVYFVWKGVEVARQYVIPANPRTGDQQAQRARLTAAVNVWHTVGFTAIDVTAWNLAALASGVAQSGFNVFCSLYILALVAAKTFITLFNTLVSGISGTGATVKVKCASDKTAKLYIGVSKTKMLTEFSGTFAAGEWTFTLTGLVSGTRYYFYIKNTAANEAAQTGIYSFKTS